MSNYSSLIISSDACDTHYYSLMKKLHCLHIHFLNLFLRPLLKKHHHVSVQLTLIHWSTVQQLITGCCSLSPEFILSSFDS